MSFKFTASQFKELRLGPVSGDGLARLHQLGEREPGSLWVRVAESHTKEGDV